MRALSLSLVIQLKRYKPHSTFCFFAQNFAPNVYMTQMQAKRRKITLRARVIGTCYHFDLISYHCPLTPDYAVPCFLVLVGGWNAFPWLFGLPFYHLEFLLQLYPLEASTFLVNTESYSAFWFFSPCLTFPFVYVIYHCLTYSDIYPVILLVFTYPHG